MSLAPSPGEAGSTASVRQYPPKVVEIPAPAAACCVHVAPWSGLMKRPIGSGVEFRLACPIVTYRTWMPPAAGGEVGGARATMTWPITTPPPSTAAMAGVAEFRTGAHVAPPSVDWLTPCPLRPA